LDLEDLVPGTTGRVELTFVDHDERRAMILPVGSESELG
jgi:hypothetical protein